jgi:hypothetical protein
MKNKFCYWTISWGDYDYMSQSLVNSAKQCGINEDFYAFTQKPINNCFNLKLNKNIELDKLQFFKFEYLKEEMSKLNYEYFIFIDSDHFFVRRPEISIEDIMLESPWHSFLESPINSFKTKREDWWQIPNKVFEQTMRENGVYSKEIRNTNGGFWICHKNFINEACRLSYNFHEKLKNKGHTVPEEVSIAYLSHLMSPRLQDRFLEKFSNYWASDWTDNFKDSLPIDVEWEYTSYMTYEKINVKPAIVHAMRSKKALVENGKSQLV